MLIWLGENDRLTTLWTDLYSPGHPNAIPERYLLDRKSPLVHVLEPFWKRSLLFVDNLDRPPLNDYGRQ